MSTHPKVTVAVLVASLAVAPLVAAQASKGQPIRKIAVIAVRDSGLFTLCPFVGRDVIESNGWESGTRSKVTVSYPVAGKQLLGFHFDDGIAAWVMLPVATTQAGPPIATTPDVEGKAELEASIRARKGYAVVDSSVVADFVLLVESTFVNMPSSMVSGGQVIDWQVDRDRPATWRQLSLAILVPGADYREHATNAVALTTGAAWEGMTFFEWGRKGGGPPVTPASLQALVDQLDGKGRKHPAYLPVCAVNGGAPY